MGLETGTYISDLVATNPATGDNASTTVGHVQLVKSTVKATFPNVTGAVTPTHTELNYVAGVTSAIQTQLGTKVAWTAASGTGGTLSAARIQVYQITGAGTVTLPTSPTAGDTVIVVNRHSVNITVDAGSNTIDQGSTTSSLAAKRIGTYVFLTNDWIEGVAT